MAGPRKGSWWDSWQKKEASGAAAGGLGGAPTLCPTLKAFQTGARNTSSGQGTSGNTSQYSNGVAAPFDKFAFTGAARLTGFTSLQKKAGESTHGSDKNEGPASIQWPSRSSNGPQGLKPGGSAGASAAPAPPPAANGPVSSSAQFKPKAFQPPKLVQRNAGGVPERPCGRAQGEFAIPNGAEGPSGHCRG